MPKIPYIYIMVGIAPYLGRIWFEIGLPFLRNPFPPH
jgi:hypothetical protein